MSYFDDQMNAWFENDCQGSIENFPPSEPKPAPRKIKVHSNLGRSRSLLALTKLEEFAIWAVADGFTREACKGTYEVLRLRWPGHAPLIFFVRDRGAHATSQSDGTQLVRRWLIQRNSKTSGGSL
jgi:hypothetical protein